MSAQPPGTDTSATSRHLAAVARSLEWAEQAAERGNYADALGWVQVVQVIGEQLSDEFEAKRGVWLTALAADHTPDRATRRASQRPAEYPT